MNGNPYSFTPDGANSSASEQLQTPSCPELCDNFGVIEGSIEKDEALRIAKRCKPLRAPDPVSGRVPKVVSLNSWVPFIVVIVSGAILSPLFRSEPFNLNVFRTPTVMIYWLSVLIPAASVIALWLIFRRYRFHMEEAHTPVWGQWKIEPNPCWYSVKRSWKDGPQTHALFSWAQVQVQCCDDAWLLNHGGANPLLVLRKWMNETQQAVLDEFLTALVRWQSSPAAQQLYATTMPVVFPPLLEVGIQFQVTQEAMEEFRKTHCTKLREEFPDLFGSRFLGQPLFWKGWAVFVGCSALAYPMYVLTLGQRSNFSVIFLLGLIVAWVLYKTGRPARNSIQLSATGVITEDVIWTDWKTLRGSLLLSNVKKFRLIDDYAVVSFRDQRYPFILSRRLFSDETQWHAACARLESAARAAGAAAH